MDKCVIATGLLIVFLRQVVSFTVSGEKGPLEARRGGNITLNCYVQGADYDGLDHTIKWAKVIDGRERIISANTIINSRSPVNKYHIYAVRDMPTYFLDLQLKIVELGLEDNGTYMCLVLDVGGHDVLGNYKVEVLIREQVRRLDLLFDDGSNGTSYDEDMKVDYTQPGDITCQASGGNPPPKLKVYLRDQDITEWFIQRRMSVTYTGTQPWNQKFVYNTQITCPRCKLSPGDNGKILQCESTVPGFDTIVTASKRMVVFFKPQIDCPEKYLAPIGARNFVLKCDVTANPNATNIRWEIGENTVLDGNEMDLQYNAIIKYVSYYIRRAALAVYKVEDHNFRVKYRLLASNKYGESSRVITLLPGGQPGHATLYNTRISSTSSPSESTAPSICLHCVLILVTILIIKLSSVTSHL